MLALLRAAYEVAPRRRRAKAAPKPGAPKQAELRYLRLSREVAAIVRDAVAQAFGDDLERFAAPTMDAPGDPLPGGRRTVTADQLIARARELISEEFARRKLEEAIARIGDDVNVYNIRDMSRVLGITPEALDPSMAHVMDTFRRTNVQLITSIAEEHLGEVEVIVQSAVRDGIRVEALRDEIQRRYEVTRSRAELIARDQVLKANADLTRERQQRVGIKRYRWVTSNDARVREGHRALNGQIFEWAVPPVVDPKTGRMEHPGRDFQCRCTASPIFDDDD
jgi:SPP1 gp7 family putative phage head morphogenesis protein